MAKRIVFATGNAGKMKEVSMILKDLGLPVVSMKEAGIEADIVEDGTTFAENAEIKARTVYEQCHDIVLADDSGLEIDHLNKEPGIYSARYMEEERSARFVCAIAAVLPDGAVLHSYGTIEGIIGYEEQGENGFGYDPIFYLPEYGCTTAQLAPEVKNELSHRGKALRAMKEQLRGYLGGTENESTDRK